MIGEAGLGSIYQRGPHLGSPDIGAMKAHQAEGSYRPATRDGYGLNSPTPVYLNSPSHGGAFQLNGPSTGFQNTIAQNNTNYGPASGGVRQRQLGSPGKPEMFLPPQSRGVVVGHSQPRAPPTNRYQQESVDGRQITSTDSRSRNPLLVSYGEASRDPTFSRSGVQFNRAGGSFEAYTDSTTNKLSNPVTLTSSQNNQFIGQSSLNYQQPMQQGVNMNLQANQYGNYQNSYGGRNIQPGVVPKAAIPSGGMLNRAGPGQEREDIELLRSKNKAFASVTRDMFPEFLDKIRRMTQTVHRNINLSFTAKLKDIWESYINDQSSKSNMVMNKPPAMLLQDIRPIEEASVEALFAQTEHLILKIKSTQLDEIKRQLTMQSGEADLDRNHPLFDLETEYRFQREKLDQATEHYNRIKKDEEKQLLEMKKRHNHAVQQHFDSHRKDFHIKVSTDPDIAKEQLYQAREFYMAETKRMQSDLGRGGRKYELTMSQDDKIKELEQRIHEMRHKVSMYSK